jgi:hypothetical protein
MAQTHNARRFYIDHGDDQPIVRTVPVRRAQPSPPSDPTGPSVATHQVTPAAPVETAHVSARSKARHAPRNVSRLVRLARKRPDSSRT